MVVVINACVHTLLRMIGIQQISLSALASVVTVLLEVEIASLAQMVIHYFMIGHVSYPLVNSERHGRHASKRGFALDWNDVVGNFVWHASCDGCK